MRVLVAFDKFKHALSAEDACAVAARVISELKPGWDVEVCPLTDGGDGFESTLGTALRAEQVQVPVMGPRGGLVPAGVHLLPLSSLPAPAASLLQPAGPFSAHTRLAIVEMAAASGLHLLAPEMRDPWLATTYGTGQLLRAAAELGAGAIVLGIGGSATNDLGTGALSALGVEFRSAGGDKIRPPVPRRWPAIERLEGAAFDALPPLLLATDVDNPLLGTGGATATFGPQKGLPPEDVAALDAEAGRMARLLCHHFDRPTATVDTPGAGAAGGLAFGLLCGTRAHLVPGFRFAAACTDLERRLERADVVLTGEGRFDSTSLQGKGPGALVLRAIERSKRAWVIAGHVDAAAMDGVQFHALNPAASPPDAATLARTAADLAEGVRQLLSGERREAPAAASTERD